MRPSLFLGLLVLVHSCWSVSILVGVPEVSPPLLSPSCNDSRVLSMANFALQGINNDRKEGYVFALNRVANVHEHRQEGSGSMYYLTLDVIETECHVLSKKNWKDCARRILHNIVYGQCKAIFYLNLPERILHLHAYNCTIRPVSRRSIVLMCPDCPGPVSTNISDPFISETVRESLKKINREAAVGKKLYLFQVTKAYSQWVFGPSFFLEYLVTEAPCTKALPGLEKCLQPPADSKPIGLCKGSLAKNGPVKHVDGSCEFFQIKPTVAPGSQPTEHQIPQQVVFQSTAAPVQEEPKGSVQVLPDLDEDNFEYEVQGTETAQAVPVSLDLTTDPQGMVIHLPIPPLVHRNPPIVLPFPRGSKSKECPGPAENSNPLILPP